MYRIKKDVELGQKRNENWVLDIGCWRWNSELEKKQLWSIELGNKNVQCFEQGIEIRFLFIYSLLLIFNIQYLTYIYYRILMFDVQQRVMAILFYPLFFNPIFANFFIIIHFIFEHSVLFIDNYMTNPNTNSPFQINQPNPFNLPSTNNLFANPSTTQSGTSSYSLFALNPATSNPRPFGSSTANPFASLKQQNTTNQPSNPFTTNNRAFAPVSNTNKEQTSIKQMPSLNLSGKNEETKKQGTVPLTNLFGVHINSSQSAAQPAKNDLASIFSSSETPTPTGNLFNATKQNNPKQEQSLFGQNETSSKSSEKSSQRKQSDKSKQRVGSTNPLKTVNTDPSTRQNPNPSFLSSTGIPTFMMTPKDQPLLKQQPQQKQQQQKQQAGQKMETLQQKTQKFTWSFPAPSISSTSMLQTQKKDNFFQQPKQPSNPTKNLDEGTVKKGQQSNSKQMKIQNPQQKGNEVQKNQKTQQLAVESKDKNRNIYQEVLQDIQNGRQMTSKAQMKELLEEEKKNVKQKLVNKLKDNKKPVNFDNHNVVYNDLWNKRIRQAEQEIKIFEGYKAILEQQIKALDNHLFIEKQQKQKYKGIMEIANPDLPPVPQQPSISLEEYNKQMQLYKQQQEILEQENEIEQLKQERAIRQKKVQALEQQEQEIENKIKQQQTIYNGLDHQIIDIFHNQHQFREYFVNQLVAERNKLMSKYQQLKMQIKKIRKNNRSKF